MRDAASSVSYGVFYDNNAEGCFDLGCEHHNHFGRYRIYEAEDGDLEAFTEGQGFIHSRNRFSRRARLRRRP